MKIITLCEPYATLVCLPDSDPRAKRVENRTWPTRYRGPLVIHAGKGRGWIDPEMGDPWPDGFGLRLSDLTFGAVLGRVDLVDCVPAIVATSLTCPERLRWMRDHQHTEGPWCWVVSNVRRLPTPILHSGERGLRDVPPELAARVVAAIGAPVGAEIAAGESGTLFG